MLKEHSLKTTCVKYVTSDVLNVLEPPITVLLVLQANSFIVELAGTAAQASWSTIPVLVHAPLDIGNHQINNVSHAVHNVKHAITTQLVFLATITSFP